MTHHTHWRDRAIEASEAISDGFEVLKAYGARVAEWILFFCLIANIIELFPLPEPFASVFGNIVLGIQAVTLDIAGFGLATMGDHARRRGDSQAARKASTMGWTLISLMMVTVGLVTLTLIVPATKPTIDTIEKALVLARVIMTVLYGHIVHSLRNAGVEYENRVVTLEQTLSTVQAQVQTKQQEVESRQSTLSTVQARLSSEQAKVSTLQRQLDTAHGLVDSMQQELERVRGQVDSGQHWQTSRVSSLQEQLDTEQATSGTLRRQLQRALDEVSDLREHLTGVQAALSSEQAKVSTLQQHLSRVSVHPVSRKPGVQVSTGQAKMDSGQAGKVLQLARPRKSGQDDGALENQIRSLLQEEPGLSGRAIAARLGCSPTTAAKWKTLIEQSA